MGRYLCLLLVVLLGAACSSTAERNTPPPQRVRNGTFQFGLMGDMPYTKEEERLFENLIASLNAAKLAFAVHVGDMQLDSRHYDANAAHVSLPCSDEYDSWFLGVLQQIRHPVIVTPGDNDWTDCHFMKARKVDPLDRLAKVRKAFFPEGKSLGTPTIDVESQGADTQFAKFRENLTWSMGGVTFATIHVVGSDDNFGRTPEMDSEYRERKSANLAWIKRAFARARSNDNKGLVLMLQANPRFENRWGPTQRAIYVGVIEGLDPPAKQQSTAFDDYITLLQEEMETFGKPVAFLHGDTHRFRIDQPLYNMKTRRRFERFVRVETFGSPDIHWVKVTVDPDGPQLFSFEPQIVPGNASSPSANQPYASQAWY